MSHTLDLLIYPDCQLLDASGPWQVFATANELAGKPLYQLRLLAESTGPVTTNGGMTLQATHALATTPPGDTLLIAGGSGVHALDDAIIETVARRAVKTPRVGSICTGAFALARAGLLDNRCATTHWRHAEALAHRFPAIRVEADALYLESNGIYTSAGVTAGIDLALSLLALDQGATLAGAVARELVMFLHRPGNQAQFSEGLKAQLTSQKRLRQLVDRVTADPLARQSPERAMALFHGPDSYITPNWYPTRRAHGRVVPTWHYLSVQAHGTLPLIEDADWLHDHVDRLTRRFEREQPAPWSISEAPEDYIDGLCRAIVGVELSIEHLIGKHKAAQHKDVATQFAVFEGLLAEGWYEEHAVWLSGMSTP